MSTWIEHLREYEKMMDPVRLKELLEMIDCELARFAVIEITTETTLSRRPGVRDRDSHARHEVPDLTCDRHGVIEGRVVSMDKNIGMFSRCLG